MLANAGTSEIKNFDDPKELRADMAAKLCAETALPETRLAIHNPRKGLLRNAVQTEEDFISLPFFDFPIADFASVVGPVQTFRATFEPPKGSSCRSPRNPHPTCHGQNGEEFWFPYPTIEESFSVRRRASYMVLHRSRLKPSLFFTFDSLSTESRGHVLSLPQQYPFR